MTGDARAGLLEDAFDGVEGGLGVEGVECGLDEEDVRAAVEQAACGFGVGGDKLVEGDVAVAGVVHVGGDGERLVGGAEASGDEAGLVGIAVGVVVGDFSRQSRRFAVYFVHAVLEAELGEAVAGGGEGVGGENVGAGVEVLALDVADEVGLGEDQNVYAALEVVVVGGELVASEVGSRSGP